MLCPAIAFVLFLLIIPWIQLKYDIMVFSVGLVLTGVLLYKYLGYVRQHRWFEFEKTERELGQSGSLDDVEEENEHKKLLRDGKIQMIGNQIPVADYLAFQQRSSPPSFLFI